MKKNRKLIKEFSKIHRDYSLKNMGYWKRNWRKELKYADLEDGLWYWKRYKIVKLYEISSNTKP